jgi:hypothetical protein
MTLAIRVLDMFTSIVIPCTGMAGEALEGQYNSVYKNSYAGVKIGTPKPKKVQFARFRQDSDTDPISLDNLAHDIQ